MKECKYDKTGTHTTDNEKKQHIQKLRKCSFGTLDP